MITVKEILKKNNMELDISEAALNLEFEGDFKFSGTSMVPMGDQWDHDGEYTLGYVFDSKDKRLTITPEDPHFVVGYNTFYDEAKTRGYYMCYNSDGEPSMYM